jgi:phage terminase large subunit-like protein
VKSLTGEALDRLASFVLEDGRRWGEAATNDQWEDAEAILDVESDVLYHYQTRARGYSKTTDLAGIAMAVMLTQVPAGARLYACAADQDQGRLIVDSIDGFCRRTPSLEAAFTIGSAKVTCAANGSTLTVLTADAASAYGLRPFLTIIDELAVWGQTPEPRRLFEALTTAAPKVNGRVVIITSAGDPASWAYDVLEHAREDPLWRVHELEGPPPWLDHAQLESQRGLHSASVYARLYENRWVASEDRLTTRADVIACTTLSGPLLPTRGTEYALGVDVGITNDRTAICVCHAEPRQEEIEPTLPRIVLDRLVVRTGTPSAPVDLAEVEELVAHLSQTFNWATVVIDPTEAILMAQRLRRRGVPVEKFRFSSASVGELATTLYLLLRNHALALPDEESLFAELVNVRLRETSPNTYRLDHDAGQHDDQAIALALAANHLIKHPPGSGPRIRVVGDSGPSREVLRNARSIAYRLSSGY